jgi:UDP-N-acetylmuramoyl-L-alanyl-D-glutamate--2,6-diaminopimelate ligase
MVFNGLTTPDPVLLHAEFAQMRANGAQACAIEASSIGLAEQRLAGTAIRVAMFTNFTQDHLDYHGNMQAYWQAKLALFDWQGVRSAVINLDDPQGAELAQHCAARGVQVWTVSLLRTDARLWAQTIEYTDTGMRFTVCEGAQHAALECPVVGDYNISNLIGVVAALRSLDGLRRGLALHGCAWPHGMRDLARCTNGGRGLRPHARRIEQGARRSSPHGAGARWPAMVCIWLRRRPRCQ